MNLGGYKNEKKQRGIFLNQKKPVERGKLLSLEMQYMPQKFKNI